ncbi:TPA: hypothetical protein HNO18_20870 [Escherichia coli]|nr:hypothetical protein [Escherichia coli]
MITSIHITTPLNYRRAVSVRSDFPEYHNFPEVYHAEEIIISGFYAGTPDFSGCFFLTDYSVVLFHQPAIDHPVKYVGTAFGGLYQVPDITY